MFDESRFKESQEEDVIGMSGLENIDDCIDKDDDNNSERIGIDGKNRLHGGVWSRFHECTDVCDGIFCFLSGRPSPQPSAKSSLLRDCYSKLRIDPRLKF